MQSWTSLPMFRLQKRNQAVCDHSLLASKYGSTSSDTALPLRFLKSRSTKIKDVGCSGETKKKLIQCMFTVYCWMSMQIFKRLHSYCRKRQALITTTWSTLLKRCPASVFTFPWCFLELTLICAMTQMGMSSWKRDKVGLIKMKHPLCSSCSRGSAELHSCSLLSFRSQYSPAYFL